MSDETTIQTDVLSQVQLDRAAFDSLWQAADDIERRFLSLAFRLDIDRDGWTVDGYTETELLDLMPYPPSSVSRKRLKAIIAHYKAVGVLQTHPPRGHRRRLKFAFVKSAASDRLSQRSMNVILDPPQCDPGSHPDAAAPSPATLPESTSNVIGDHPKSDPGSPSVGSPITSAIDSDLDDDQIKTSINHDPSDQGADKASLLAAAGVSLKAFSEDALLHFNAMTVAEVSTVIENAFAGKRLGRVQKPQAFIAKCIANYEGAVSTDYLDAWRDQEQTREAAATLAEEVKARDAYLNSPAYRAEYQARQAARQQAYEHEKAAFEALLEDTEKIEPWSFWWKAWQGTLGQLHIQLHRASYNTWIAGAEAVAYDAATHTVIVSVLDQYDKDWLEQRLYRLVQGSLETISGQRDVAVRFVVAPQERHVYAFRPLPEGLPGFTDKAS